VRPLLIERPAPSIKQLVESWLLVPCAASGSPAPSVHWFRNAVHINNTRRFYSSMLSVCYVQLAYYTPFVAWSGAVVIFRRVPPVFRPRGSRLSALSVVIITSYTVVGCRWPSFPVAAPPLPPCLERTTAPLHWRIKFKLAVLVYKFLYGRAPKYLVEDCELVAAADRRQLRSSDVAAFVVPRTNTRLGDRAFPVAGPRLWNSLPSNLRHSYPSAVPPGVKDVFVWSTETPAPSDFCL